MEYEKIQPRELRKEVMQILTKIAQGGSGQFKVILSAIFEAEGDSNLVARILKQKIQVSSEL